MVNQSIKKLIRRRNTARTFFYIFFALGFTGSVGFYMIWGCALNPQWKWATTSFEWIKDNSQYVIAAAFGIFLAALLMLTIMCCINKSIAALNKQIGISIQMRNKARADLWDEINEKAGLIFYSSPILQAEASLKAGRAPVIIDALKVKFNELERNNGNAAEVLFNEGRRFPFLFYLFFDPLNEFQRRSHDDLIQELQAAHKVLPEEQHVKSMNLNEGTVTALQDEFVRLIYGANADTEIDGSYPKKRYDFFLKQAITAQEDAEQKDRPKTSFAFARAALSELFCCCSANGG